MTPDQAAPQTAPVTAAVLVIGDEILSGRTKDKNIGYIADYMTNIGIDLREVRIVPDVMEDIVAALNALRVRYTYVFTTGGIGPTHDDITADAVAQAFGVELYEDQRIIEAMLTRIKPEDLNASRRRMARVPQAQASSSARDMRRRRSAGVQVRRLAAHRAMALARSSWAAPAAPTV